MYVYFHYIPPTRGSGPAGPAVSRDAFTKPWSDRHIELLGMGDSITAGFGVSDRPLAYFNRLERNPENEFPEMEGIALSRVLPNVRSKNLSMSGSTSIECLDDQLPLLKTASADWFGIVVITTGGNDLIHNYGHTPPREGAMYGATMEEAGPWIENFEKRLHTIFDVLNARYPGGCYIFLANIYDPSDGVGDPSIVFMPPWPDLLKIHHAYNGVIKRVADERDNVWIADIQGPFLGHGFFAKQFWRANYHRDDAHLWYQMNIEDPNDRGYDAIRRVFLNAIAGAIKERPIPAIEGLAATDLSTR